MEQTTPKQLNILLLLYRFRFLNRIQIQKFLNHKSPRRINTWLKDLTTRNIIGQKYSKKLLANTKPAIYHLSTKSRKILLKQPNINEKLLKRVYREKTRSDKLINHCLLIADFYFLIKQQAQTKKNKTKLHFYTKTDLVTHYYLPYKRPDAYIAIKDKDTQRYFLEIIDEGTPRFMIRSKINQYINYADNKNWEKNTNHPFPSILVICPNEDIYNFLLKHITQVLEEEVETEIDFYLTTKDIIKSTNTKTDIWQKVEV
ncbi:hypothetical protein HN803_06800 [candidate division WWE3 bacterium]|jgi:hypothetical protein|nr:hypothetical protein [candidate division WWE3 bacterium]MBT7350460.1 hypothetical protein [candidate division WWE3 bacterium]